MKDITDAYIHEKGFYKFSNTNFWEYHDLYVPSNSLLLADVLKNYGHMCLKIYELDPPPFLTAQGLTWQVTLKITKVKLDLLTSINMLLIIKIGIRGGICHPYF